MHNIKKNPCVHIFHLQSIPDGCYYNQKVKERKVAKISGKLKMALLPITFIQTQFGRWYDLMHR